MLLLFFLSIWEKKLYVIWYYIVESLYIIPLLFIGTMLMYSFCYFYFMCNILQSRMLISTDLQLFLFFITISIKFFLVEYDFKSA